MGCFTFIKVMMVAFNLLILVCGLTVAALGIWISVDQGASMNVLRILSLDPLQYINVGYFFIAIGGVLALMGFLGCYSAQKESKCLLILFFSIVLMIFISELATGVIILAYSSLLEKVLKSWTIPVLQEQFGRDKVVTDMWNVTMTKLHCCGFTNYTDFTYSYYYKQHWDTYPPSCCEDPELFCDTENAMISEVQGCYERLSLTLKKKTLISGGVAAGVCGVELAVMALSMYLFSYLDRQDNQSS